MKTSVALSFLVLSLAPFSGRAANLLVNGDLESNTGGLPNGWTYTQGDGPATLQSASVSPFTNIYPAGTASALFADGSSTTVTPLLLKTFPIQSGGILHVAWDFRLSSLTGNPWAVQIDDSVTALLKFDMDRTASNFFSVEVSGGGYADIMSLAANTWYQVQLALDATNKTLTGSITSETFVTTPIATQSWRVTPAGTQSLDRVVILDDALSTAAAGNTLFDNFAVDRTAFAPAPEPSTALLLGLGGVAVAARRTRRG